MNEKSVSTWESNTRLNTPKFTNDAARNLQNRSAPRPGLEPVERLAARRLGRAQRGFVHERPSSVRAVSRGERRQRLADQLERGLDLLEADLHARHRVAVGVTRDLERRVAVVRKVAPGVEIDAGAPRDRADAAEVARVLLGERAGADQPIEERVGPQQRPSATRCQSRSQSVERRRRSGRRARLEVDAGAAGDDRAAQERLPTTRPPAGAAAP